MNAINQQQQNQKPQYKAELTKYTISVKTWHPIKNVKP
jgi:hypothetical protein